MNPQIFNGLGNAIKPGGLYDTSLQAQQQRAREQADALRQQAASIKPPKPRTMTLLEGLAGLLFGAGSPEAGQNFLGGFQQGAAQQDRYNEQQVAQQQQLLGTQAQAFDRRGEFAGQQLDRFQKNRADLAEMGFNRAKLGQTAEIDALKRAFDLKKLAQEGQIEKDKITSNENIARGVATREADKTAAQSRDKQIENAQKLIAGEHVSAPIKYAAALDLAKMDPDSIWGRIRATHSQKEANAIISHMVKENPKLAIDQAKLDLEARKANAEIQRSRMLNQKTQEEINAMPLEGDIGRARLENIRANTSKIKAGPKASATIPGFAAKMSAAQSDVNRISKNLEILEDRLNEKMEPELRTAIINRRDNAKALLDQAKARRDALMDDGGQVAPVDVRSVMAGQERINGLPQRAPLSGPIGGPPKPTKKAKPQSRMVDGIKVTIKS